MEIINKIRASVLKDMILAFDEKVKFYGRKKKEIKSYFLMKSFPARPFLKQLSKINVGITVNSYMRDICMEEFKNNCEIL